MEYVEDKSKVAIAYTLKEITGRILEEIPATHPFVYIHGYNNIIPGLENALEGKRVGDFFSIKIPFNEGYGPYKQDLLFFVPKEELEDIGEIWLGMELEMIQENDTREFQIPDSVDEFIDALNIDEDSESENIYVIKEIYKDKVLVDGNHPFAGKDLIFDVQVISVETPTYTELESGYPDKNEFDEDYHEEF